MSWVTTINAILNGEPVSAEVTNRAVLELAQNTEYLHDLIRSMAAGQALIAKRLPVDPAVLVGDVVYFKKSTSKYDKALAAVDSIGTSWFAADSAQVTGVVLYKDSSNNADVLVAGSLILTDYLTAAGRTLNDLLESGTFGTGGVFYASSTTPGKITTVFTTVSALVGAIDASGRITLNPTTIGSNRDHTHFEVDLVAEEAATAADRGWLVANSGNFPGMTIPVDATYGYNISHADETDLRAVFPPVPINFFRAEKNGIGLDSTSLVINDDNIWWTGPVGVDDPWTSWSQSGEDAALKLWITSINQTDSIGSVISLESNSSDPARIPVTLFRSGAAVSGPATGVLKLATAPFVTDPTPSEAVTALKGLAGTVKTVGPIVSRIKAGPGLSISSANGDAASGFYGLCQVTLEDAISLLGGTEVAVLNGAREDITNGIHGIILPKGKNTSVRFKMKLGANSGGTKIRFMLNLYCAAGGALPSLNISYRQIPAPSLSVASAIPASDTVAPSISGHAGIVLPANGQILSQSAQLPLSGSAASDETFFVEISRAGTTDGFISDIGILEAYYVFE